MSFINFIQILKGGTGSGNFHHSGIPGKVGGSAPGSGGLYADRGQTMDIKLPNADIIAVDKGIADMVKIMNKVGLETYQSCSGHTCDDPLESQLSFRAPSWKKEANEAYTALSDLVQSNKLNHQWEIAKHAYDPNHRELRVVGGLYSGGTIISTDTNVHNARQDFRTMTNVLKSIHEKYKD